MIQDIYPSQMDISFKNIKPDADSIVMAFKDGNILVLQKDNGIEFPAYDKVNGEVEYIFTIDDKKFFILFEEVRLCGYEYMSVKEVRKLENVSKEDKFATFTAFHLYSWYESNRFCGKCGSKTGYDDIERALVCPKCGNKIYPRINPAVIVGIRNNDRILITKYRRGYGHSALVAGFTEIGETFEETVKREVLEEVGLKVKNIEYYKSQPWGVAADILAGFFFFFFGDDTIKMDEGELKYAEWVKREDIELQPDDLSLTNEMMKLFRDQK